MSLTWARENLLPSHFVAVPKLIVRPANSLKFIFILIESNELQARCCLSNILRYIEFRLDLPNALSLGETEKLFDYQEVWKYSICYLFGKGRPENKCFWFDLDMYLGESHSQGYVV